MPKFQGETTSFNFSKRYNRNMLLTFVVSLLISMALITLRIHSNSRQELLQRFDTFKSKSIALDNLVGDISKHVHLLQLNAELYYIGKRDYNTKLMGSLAQTDHNNLYYSLDTIPPPFKIENIGNLTGMGRVDELSEQVKEEVGMALALNPIFQATKNNIPGAAWVYYTSKSKFINIYPWTHSTGFKFTNDLYTHEFYKWALPEKNKERTLFWTPAYIDEYGKGLMVSAAKPVYNENRFLGTVAIDITLSSLADSINSTDQSTMLVVNEQNQLLGHSDLIKSKDSQIKMITAALPEELNKNREIFFSTTPLTNSKFDSYYCTYYQMKNAPWKVVFLMKQNYIWIKSSTTVGIVFFTLIGGLAGMLLITNRMTFREFINPAEKLVRHISRENKNETAEIPDVPQVWIPWFQTISKTFCENRKYTGNLESLVYERTYELKFEKEKSDNLLLNVLPQSIATRLKSGENQIADHYADVSVLFADLVGFTKLSSKIDANRLVEILNNIFSNFDSIVDEYGLEKIKTIGDAYMLAGGIPIPNSTHLKKTVLAAISMLKSLEKIQRKSSKKVQIRIGIHVGPLVAGVIGKSKFIYDMWGDTVNVASRMESSGAPGRIHVSEVIYERLKNDFEFEKRELIDVKGKGLMQSYYLLDSKQVRENDKLYDKGDAHGREAEEEKYILQKI